MTTLLNRDTTLDTIDQHIFFDDFNVEDIVAADVGTERWIITADAGGVQGVDLDGVGGIYSIKCDGDDNDEAYIETRELWLFADNAPLIFQTRVSFTEANTDDAGVVVGLVDAPGADQLADTGGACAINNSGALFYKLDGATVWRFKSNAAGGTATDSVSTTTAGGSYQVLRITATVLSATNIKLTPTIDGNSMLDATTGDVISHTVTSTSATEMAIIAGVKAGGANEETLLIDYVYCAQKRT